MTALERIKEIEQDYLDCGLEEDEEFKFILKAFRVMREIAIERETKFENFKGPLPVIDVIGLPQCTRDWIDKWFEDRMKDIQ